MALLTGVSEEVKGKKIPITEEKLTIGRTPDNTLAIDNSTVSSHHCEVWEDGQRFYVRDLGSTNGTRVNNQEVTERKLKPKDVLQVGSVELIFDALPGEVVNDEPEQTAVVEVAPGPTEVPESFGSISPFGARRSERKGLWFALIFILGLVALAALAMLIYQLSATS